MARHALRLLLVSSLLSLLLVSCGDDDEAADGPFRVGTRTFDFVDESRPTPAHAGMPEKPSRALVTNVWYPAEGERSGDDVADAEPADGPFPLIVYSHGQSGAPEDYAPVFHRWAEAGYVVAAPRHPITIRGTPGGPATGDFGNQPADLSFVIDRMAAEQEDLVDADRVAVGGHSLGAIVALGAGAHPCCQDDRIDAIVIMSIRPLPFSGGEYHAEGLPETPSLFFHGDKDQYFAYSGGREVFDAAPAPKAFVTIAGGDHSRPYRRGPPDPGLAAKATIAFLDNYVAEREDGLEAFEETVAEYDFAELELVPAR